MVVTLIAVMLLAAVLSALTFTWYRCHVRLRAKGYGRFVITLSLFGSFVASFLLLSRTGNDTITTFGAPGAWILFAMGLSRIAPTRAGGARRPLAPRRAGRRRAAMPTVLGWLATAGGGAMTLFFLWQLVSPTIVPRDEGWPALLAMVAITLAVSQYWFNVARRTKAAPVVLEPSQAAVLYLRAFEEEQRPFAIGPRSVLRRYTSQFAAHAPFTRGDPTIKLTLEDFLEEAITAQLGPFVGLGNPHDRLHPDGAVREYAADDVWQKRFLELAHSATCIVVSVGGSVNLQWELEQIKEHGLTQKLCLFTSPRVPGSDSGIINTLRRSQARRDEDLAATWVKSIGALRRAGYECDAACPGAGAAVTFDERGKGTVLTADATTPGEFITPVADWFKTGQRTGKCVAVSCSVCGARTHIAQGSAANSALCHSCCKAAERAGMPLTERHKWLFTVWGFASFVIAAILMTAWHVESAVLGIAILVTVFFFPIVVAAFWTSARQRAREERLARDG